MLNKKSIKFIEENFSSLPEETRTNIMTKIRIYHDPQLFQQLISDNQIRWRKLLEKLEDNQINEIIFKIKESLNDQGTENTQGPRRSMTRRNATSNLQRQDSTNSQATTLTRTSSSSSSR